MNKYILSIGFLIILTTQNIWSQNNTNSPYSKLGLGDFYSLGYGRSSAMGGVGYALSSGNELNLVNPASLSNLDSLISLFEIGLHGDYTQLKNSSVSDGRWNGNVSHISYGMAVNGKWGMAFGVAPYTNVGYDISVNQSINGIPDEYAVSLEGSGGLSTVYWSNGYRISKNASLGITASFLFGPKNEDQYYDLENISSFSLIRQVSDKYSGFKFDIGYQQTIPLGKDHSLGIGLVANIPGKLNRKTSEIVIQNSISGSITDTLLNEEDVKSSLYFPMNLGAGISYNYKNQFMVAMDYTLNRWSEVGLSDNYAELIDNHVFALGLEYTPKKKGVDKSEIHYRMGCNYQTGYYLIDNNALKSMDITAGVGFPIRNTLFNIYTAYGWRGVLNNQLIKENSLRVGINMSFKDLWFHKKQFR